MNRLVIVPDERLEPLVHILKGRVAAVASEVKSEHFGSLMTEQCRRTLLGFVRNRKEQELLLWGCSDGVFRVAWTSLSPQSEVLNIVTAARDGGLPARVCASASAFTQTADELQAATWTNLEERRGRALQNLAASPVILFHKCAAVLSLASYRSEEGPQLSPETDLSDLLEISWLLARLLEDRLLRSCLGMESL
jgi:hypothetical protein